MERDTDIEIRLLIEAIYLKYSYDFRDYSGASIKRRVHHALSQFECRTISALQERVLHDPGAFMQLLQFLTIPVSEMFRDPSHFLAIREEIVPLLRTYPSIKIWIAGCSTGKRFIPWRFCCAKKACWTVPSSMPPISIRTRWIKPNRDFSLENVRAYTQNYQNAGGRRSFADYYTAAYDYAMFDKTLCENVTFADHSLATDSVFSETQLISCRNVLIYFNKKLQDRAFGLFHESLCHRGFLVLGSKETLDFSAYGHRFEPLVKQERIYRKL